MNRLLSAFAVAAAAVLASSQAGATNMYDGSVSTATAINNSMTTINGTLNDTNGNAQPWTAEVFANLHECLRFFVTTTAFDAEITVLSPDGTAYRDDDSGGQNRPLVRIPSTPVQGWYTVQVAHFAGLPQNANFVLKYGRYNLGNPNCDGAPGPLADQPGMQLAKDPAMVQTAVRQPNAP